MGSLLNDPYSEILYSIDNMDPILFPELLDESTEQTGNKDGKTLNKNVEICNESIYGDCLHFETEEAKPSTESVQYFDQPACTFQTEVNQLDNILHGEGSTRYVLTNPPPSMTYCVVEQVDQNSNIVLVKQPPKRKQKKKSLLPNLVSINDAKKTTNPEILEFQKRLRQHRTELGLTQQEAARSILKLTGKKISQTLISRFETNQLHPKNTLNLIPDMEKWIHKSSIISTRNLILWSATNCRLWKIRIWKTDC